MADGLLPVVRFDGVRRTGTVDGASFQPPLSRLNADALGGGANGADGVGPR